MLKSAFLLSALLRGMFLRCSMILALQRQSFTLNDAAFASERGGLNVHPF